MAKVTNTLQSLIFGDRGLFILNRDTKASLEKPSNKKLAKTLMKMENKGYVVADLSELLKLSIVELDMFKQDFAAVLDNSTKSGVVLRTTFFDEPFPTEYTDGEWRAIFAQYAITYGWSEQYEAMEGSSAEQVLGEYTMGMSDKAINLVKNTKAKTIKIGNLRHDLVNAIRLMLESPVVLRTQQVAILKECPASVLKAAARGTNIPIKETLVLVMSLLKDEDLDFALLKTGSDVLRFIVSVYAEQPIEGQILKADLKDCKIHIPTSARKTLLNNLEIISSGQKGAEFLTEDMYQQESYWKIIHKYLQFEKYEKAREKYPCYTAAIDLLYEGDRSWTFNGRFSAAKTELDYEKAINVAAEKPGFLLRNMMEFMRMSKGTKMPKKVSTVAPKPVRPANNPFQDKLEGIKSKVPHVPKPKTKVQTDAHDFFKGTTFKAICDNRLNTKLAFQLIEQMENPRNNQEQHKRVVQGITINYEVPVPKLDKKMKKTVLKTLSNSISEKLQAKNKSVPNVFIADDVKEYALQYSGHESTEISYSGEYMAKNSVIPLKELGGSAPIVRLGVMWRGKDTKGPSIDIDHSVTLLHKDGRDRQVYYGNPTYSGGTRNMTLASSSGDITSCGGNTSAFSTEIVDLDIAGLKADGVTNFFNTFIDFGGRTSIGNLECYIFMQILKAKTVPTRANRSNVQIDLGRTDYAIQIDPNNVDNTGSYIGLHFDLENDQIEVLAIPVKSPSGEYSNVRTMGPKFFETIQSRNPPLTLGYALDKAFSDDQVVTLHEDASIVISRQTAEELNLEDTQTLLHPGKDGEKINEFIFA